MKVTCQSCQAKYTIADEKVRGKVAKIRCKKCGTTILVDGTDGSGAAADGPASTSPVVPDSAPQAADALMASSPEAGPALAAEAIPDLAPSRPMAPEPVALRRPGRSASTDLFGGARQDEAITSAAPHLPQLHAEANEKLTGQRNENSVLFSLSSLTGGNGSAPTPGPEAVPSSRTADLRSLIGNGPGPLASKEKSKLDDIMNLGGGGLYSPALISPALAPPPLELSVSSQETSDAPKGKGRIFAIFGGIVVVGAAVAVFAMTKGGDKTASTASSASTAASTMVATAEPTTSASAAEPVASAAAANSAAAEPAASAAANEAPTALAPGQQAPTTPKPEVEKEKKPVIAAVSRPAAPKPETAEKPTAAATPAPAPAPPPVTQAVLTGTASGEFDRAAAMSILSNTALAAQSCKKPDGPTGSGKVAVQYANNGLAQTATVEGPPFAGTPVGGCIAARFRATRVPPFTGSSITVHKSFFIN
jgi:predicted Zn finger-like uncharacterized protein